MHSSITEKELELLQKLEQGALLGGSCGDVINHNAVTSCMCGDCRPNYASISNNNAHVGCYCNC